ncbi:MULTISPECIES: TonB-dependent siderophore receptor [Paraburkholderia]|uniref:TonB-dependent siderophore receptor n=1 Tax=Paraburkholderia madseniana TaxID=2599607 RepID=A0AAP5EUL3_9BURK|nr:MULTISPECIES: TonB-dependent siderophore receptor [Paraburkholderia]MCX4146374.1 TonB-dependent siderophore receptor [Paraburkholderia madseniana]MDN7149320.1 TonB-dependent siderophore receptor [Paraburkholderia sp. WS6]MDQ6408200.1 TonB-dependent siderophore receptor [Paraburkholderia madseniana]
MGWATGTGRRAITVAARGIFCAAATGHAHARVTQPANDAQAKDTAVQADVAPGVTLSEIKVKDVANLSSLGLVGKRTTTGTKTDTPITEVPQTINVVTAQQIEMTGATDLNQALHYVPGFASFGSDSRTDLYAALRGFTPTLFVDGLQAPNTTPIANWRVDPYMIDSVTVLRGPASVLYGAGDPGAIVDVQTKQADGERVREVGVQIGNYARKQTMLDIGDRLDDDGKYAYRFVGVARDGNALSGPNADQRVALAPSLRWRPDSDTSLTLTATYLQDWNDISHNFLPAQGTVLPNPNGQLSHDVYTGEPTFNDYRKKQWSLGYQFSHDLNSIWTLRQNLRWMHLSLDDASVFGGGLAEGSTTDITRYAGLFQLNYSRFDIDNNAQARFGTGPLEHLLLLGFQYNRQTTTDSVWLALAPDLNLYNPVYTPVTTAIFSGPTSFGRQDLHTAMNTFGVYAQDQVKWNRWALTLGGREDWVNMQQDDHEASTQTKQDVSAFSGRVGLTYQGDYGLSPYVGYSTSFNPVIGVRMFGGGLPEPTRGRQIEAGLRWQPPRKNLMLSAVVYQINQTNVVTPTPTNLDPTGTSSVQTGEVRSRGIELNAVGDVSRELSIIASYIYQDVKNVKANDASLNNWPVDVPRPRQMASLWTDWTWHTGALAGFGIGGGIRYQSASAGAPDNSLTVASYTLYDAALHYHTRNWRLALNVANLFDRHYISGCQSYSVCAFGNERTVLANAKYTW